MRTHGGYGTAEYRSWQAAIKRCCNAQGEDFPDYGGRGIAVCDKWRHSFAAFLADVGPRPSRAYSLDRIDTNGNYEPGNVRWATRTQQNRNKRTNRRVIFNGELLTVSQLVQYCDVSHRTICNRLSAGWPVERAIIKPVQQEARSEGMRRAWARRKEAA